MAGTDSAIQETRKASAFNRNTLVVCILAFIGDVTSYMVDPTFTIFALKLGASMTFVGILGSTSDSFRLITSIPLGRFSDRWGRKPFLLIWRGGTSAANLVYGVATSFWHLVPGRMLMGLGFSASQVSLRSYLADVTHPSKLGLVMGLMSVSMGMGVILGPLIGGRMVGIYGFEGTYAIAGLVGLLGLIVVLVGVKNRTLPASAGGASHRGTILENLKTVMKNPVILSVILLSSFNMLGYRVIVEYVPAYITAIGYSAVAASDLFFIRGIATTAIRLPIGFVADRVGNWRLMLMAIAMQVAALLAVPISNDYAYQMGLMAVQGVSFGIFLVIQTTYIMQVTPPPMRGITLGAMSMITGLLGTMYGPIRGVTADILGLATAFIAMAAIIGFGTLTLAVVNAWFGRRKQAG